MQTMHPQQQQHQHQHQQQDKLSHDLVLLQRLSIHDGSHGSAESDTILYSLFD
jgi:hypothetical protein